MTGKGPETTKEETAREEPKEKKEEAKKEEPKEQKEEPRQEPKKETIPPEPGNEFNDFAFFQLYFFFTML